MSDRKNSRTPFYAVLALLLAAVTYIVFNQTSVPEKGLSATEQQDVLDVLSQRDAMLPAFQKLRERTQKGVIDHKNSLGKKLGSELIETINLYQKQLGLIHPFEYFTDSAQIGEAKRQLALAKKGLEHSERLFDENSAIIQQLSLVGRYESRIDSLKQRVESIGLAQREDGRVVALQKEITSYEAKLNELLRSQRTYKVANDSLSVQLAQRNQDAKALKDSLRLQKSMYQELVTKAAKDAKLATEMTLWYFEKDNMNKAKRRLLINEKKDYNKGSEISTIYGVFTLSQLDFKPFEIATVYLSSVEGSAAKETARVKVSVRNQVSGEFSLLPTEKLKKGTYNVRVEYDQKTILTKSFYVSQ